MKKIIILSLVFLLGFAAVSFGAGFDAELWEDKAFLHTEFKGVKEADLFIGKESFNAYKHAGLGTLFGAFCMSGSDCYNGSSGTLAKNGLMQGQYSLGGLLLINDVNLTKSMNAEKFGVDLNLDGGRCENCVKADITSFTVEAGMNSNAWGIPMAALENGKVSNYASGNGIAFSKILKPFYREIIERYIGSSSSKNLKEYEIGAYANAYLSLALSGTPSVNAGLILDLEALSKSLIKNENNHNDFKKQTQNEADKIWSFSVDGGEAAFVSSFHDDKN